jgi:hypothetical protein
MADEKKEPWLNWLALSTVILAVCATLSTFKAGGYSTRSVLSQTRAANEWSRYQSKSIKGYLYEIRKDEIGLELAALRAGKGAPGVADACGKELAAIESRLSRYEGEKSEIERAAREQERIRDDAQKRAGVFGVAVIYLQIAILLSSVAALLKKKPLWLLSLGAGAVGLVHFANGFFLFIPG